MNEVGRIITAAVIVNDVEFAGFSIPGLTHNDEIWFQLGRMTATIEYDELVCKSDGESDSRGSVTHANHSRTAGRSSSRSVCR